MKNWLVVMSIKTKHRDWRVSVIAESAGERPSVSEIMKWEGGLEESLEDGSRVFVVDFKELL